jgi:hypothetical protein
VPEIGLSSDTPVEIPTVLIEPDLETVDAPPSMYGRALALTLLTTVLWPLSPLLLVPLLGWRPTRYLLGNLGYLQQHTWGPGDSGRARDPEHAAMAYAKLLLPDIASCSCTTRRRHYSSPRWLPGR